MLTLATIKSNSEIDLRFAQKHSKSLEINHRQKCYQGLIKKLVIVPAWPAKTAQTPIFIFLKLNFF